MYEPYTTHVQFTIESRRGREDKEEKRKGRTRRWKRKTVDKSVNKVFVNNSLMTYRIIVHDWLSSEEVPQVTDYFSFFSVKVLLDNYLYTGPTNTLSLEPIPYHPCCPRRRKPSLWTRFHTPGVSLIGSVPL